MAGPSKYRRFYLGRDPRTGREVVIEAPSDYTFHQAVAETYAQDSRVLGLLSDNQLRILAQQIGRPHSKAVPGSPEDVTAYEERGFQTALEHARRAAAGSGADRFIAALGSEASRRGLFDPQRRELERSGQILVDSRKAGAEYAQWLLQMGRGHKEAEQFAPFGSRPLGAALQYIFSVPRMAVQSATLGGMALLGGAGVGGRGREFDAGFRDAYLAMPLRDRIKVVEGMRLAHGSALMPPFLDRALTAISQGRDLATGREVPTSWLGRQLAGLTHESSALVGELAFDPTIWAWGAGRLIGQGAKAVGQRVVPGLVKAIEGPSKAAKVVRAAGRTAVPATFGAMSALGAGQYLMQGEIGRALPHAGFAGLLGAHVVHGLRERPARPAAAGPPGCR